MGKWLKNNKYWVISLGIHISLVIMFNLYFDFAKPIQLGRPESIVLSSFIYQGKLTSVEQKKPQQKESSVKNIIHKNISPTVTKMNESNKLSEQASAPKPVQNSLSQGEQISQLMALLHDAIQNKQVYPHSALEMERQGRVKVSFILHKDGSISDLRMIKTSGTTSLDHAALIAVKDAAPFLQAQEYIQDSREYQIDIVFELT